MLKFTAGNYVAEVKEEVVGGGDLQQMVVLTDGKVIVLAYGMVGIYESEESYWSSKDDGLLFSEAINL